MDVYQLNGNNVDLLQIFPTKILSKNHLMAIQEFPMKFKITVRACLVPVITWGQGVSCYNSLWLKPKTSTVLARAPS